MRFCVIGDIHGRNSWEEFVQENRNCHFIFLGDYCDPYDVNISDVDSISNFESILEFKKNNVDSVTLLIGNHDAQYIWYGNYQTGTIYSNKELKQTIKTFQNNINYLQFAYQIKNNFFIHAGITNGWLREYKEVFNRFGLKDDKSNLAEIINNIGNNIEYRHILMNVSTLRRGLNMYGGPVWADKRELKNTVENLHQFVGHNKFDDIYTIVDETASITFCDVLSNTKKCLLLDL